MQIGQASRFSALTGTPSRFTALFCADRSQEGRDR